ASRRAQLLFPVIDAERHLLGVTTRNDLWELASSPGTSSLSDRVRAEPVVAYPDEPLRVVVYRMAETGLTRFPVVDRERRRLVGMVALFDRLEARARSRDAHRRRERILGVRQWRRRRRGDVPVAVRPGV